MMIFLTVGARGVYFNQMDHIGQCERTYAVSSEILVACLTLWLTIQLVFATGSCVSFHMCYIILKLSYPSMFLLISRPHFFYVCVTALIGGLLPLSC